VSDFAGKVILVEMMATWCPSCEAEMSQVQLLHDAYGPNSDLVTISLDVDPNEDSAVLKKFAAQKGFSWIIAVAPPSVRTFLAKNYDVDLLNPPLQPMLIIDREGGVWGLPFHLKSAISLKKTIDPYLAQ
jgi:thiol-disulfide isomerase/thioredoxin